MNWKNINQRQLVTILICAVGTFILSLMRFHVDATTSALGNVNAYASLQDVGIFASFDPVALDMACADACNASPIIKGSYLDEQENLSTDRFSRTHPKTNWKACIDHGVKIKLGNDKYELIKV